MAYDQKLADRLENIIARRNGFHSQKMFGGIGYLWHGHMCFGVYKHYLILRLGDEEAKKALAAKYVRPFDITGKPMKGWVMVPEANEKSEGSLKQWVERAMDFVGQLPRK